LDANFEFPDKGTNLFIEHAGAHAEIGWSFLHSEHAWIHRGAPDLFCTDVPSKTASIYFEKHFKCLFFLSNQSDGALMTTFFDISFV